MSAGSRSSQSGWTSVDRTVGGQAWGSGILCGLPACTRGARSHAQCTDRPERIREPRAFRASAVEGLGTFAALPPQHLPWSGLTVQFVAPG